MSGNQISPFEYVSILVSIILGLGITQLLSSFSDLLFNYKKVKFYWPHTIWVVFILFLHIQDWFITYQLKDKSAWELPELLFILSYPITLFIAAKMLLPVKENNEKWNLKAFYQIQYPLIFFVIAISTFISILFNILLLKKDLLQQVLLILFFVAMLFFSRKRVNNERIHKAISLIVAVASMLSVIVEKDVWVVK